MIKEINFSKLAVERINQLIAKKPSGTFFRIAVKGGGCSGFQYGLNIEDEPEADDEILDLSGVRIFVDPFSVQYLEGIEIDYTTSMMGSGFTFRNPNATGGCGCGSSFTA